MIRQYKVLFTLITLLFFEQSIAQTGPAGLDLTDAPLELWLRADQGVSEIDGLVQTWADQSGNGRDFTQATSSARPILKANALNGREAMKFTAASGTHLDGPNTNVLFGNSGNKPTEIADFIIVLLQPTSNTSDVINFPRVSGSSFFAFVSNGGDGNPREDNADDVKTFIRDASAGPFSVVSSENSAANNNGFPAGSFHVARFGFDPKDAGTNDSQWLYDIDNLVEEVNTGLDITYDGQSGSVIGTLGGRGSDDSYDGEIAELMIFSDRLRDIEYLIIQNYLNARYGLSTNNEFYAGDTGGNGDADFGVFGFGQNGAGQNVTTSNKDGLILTANAGLDNGDYVFAGYTSATVGGNGIINNDILLSGGTLQGRMKRAWFIDKTDAGTALTTDITFDLNDAGTDLPDLSSAVLGGYKLIHRSGTSGEWTVVAAAATAVSDGNKTITFESQAITDNGYYGLATDDASNSPIGDIEQTWYSFQSGSWGSSTTWTLDGATTPIFDNDNSEVPGAGDKVILTAGRTVRMNQSDGTSILNNVAVQSIVVRGSSRLRILTSTGNNLGAVSGAGTISLQGSPNTGTTAHIENLPAGDYSSFADQLLGGVLEVSTAVSGVPLLLNQNYAATSVITDPNGAISRSLILNMTLNSDVVILQRDLYLNRDLTITKGQLRIHRDNAETYTDVVFSDADLNITVNNNITVASNGSIRTGSANQRHQLNAFGNFTTNGTAYFTQRTVANTGTDATDGIVDVNFLDQEEDQSLTCNAETRFYRIEIDKASSAVFLNISASSEANFNLLGKANTTINSNLSVGGSNTNAFGLVTGGVSVGTNVVINPINTSGNYAISSLATLQIDGGSIFKTSGPAIVPYGTFRLNSGLAEILVASGLTMRDAGRVEINGGNLYANAIRVTNEASDDAGSYIQTGGDVVLNGGSGDGGTTTGATGTNTSYAVFALWSTSNVFRMSDGTLTIQRSNYNSNGGTGEDGTDDLGGSIFINSDPANYEVTGGTVIIDMDDGNPARITSRAPFYNLTLTNTSGNAIVDNNAETFIQPNDESIVFLAGGQAGSGAGDGTVTAQPLVVLNDFIIGNGTNPIRFDHLGNDITVSRNLTVSVNAQFYMGSDALLPENEPNDASTVPATHQNTVTLNGSISSTLALNHLSASGATVEQFFHNMTISKSNGSSVLVTAPNKSNAGNNANTIRFSPGGAFRLESGKLDQGERAIRFYGDVYNADTLGVFESGVTNIQALLKFRPVSFTIDTEPGAVFGNFRLNSGSAIISLENDVVIQRVEYRHGRLSIGSNNVRIDELDVNISSGQSDFGGCSGCFSVQDMIITNGNASDGGLTLRVTQANNVGNINGNATLDGLSDNDYLFPIGIGTSGLDDGSSKYTPLLLSISNVGDLGTDGEAFITVNPVEGILATTNQASESLSYYWRVRTEGFDSDPTIDLLEVFGNDDDAGASFTSYVSGKVEDGGSYTRTSELTNTEQDPANPNFEAVDFSFEFDGNGAGSFTLNDANFTAGLMNAFMGAPQIYYSRAVSGAWFEWQDEDHWSIDQVSKHTGAPISDLGGSSPGVPGVGDIVVIGSDYVNNLTGGSYADTGNDGRHQLRIDGSQGNTEVAQLIFDSFDGSKALNVTDMSRLRVRNGITFTTSIVTGNGELVQDVGPNPSNFGIIIADIGEFARDADNGWFFWIQANGTTIVNDFDEYPTFRTFGGNANRFFQFGKPIEARNMLIDNSVTFQVANDLTIDSLVRIGSNNEGIVEFIDNSGSSVMFECGSIEFAVTNQGNANTNRFIVENSGSDIHTLRVNSNITLNLGTEFGLASSGSNVILELAGEGNHSFADNDGDIAMDLYKLVVNKGTNTSSSFTIPDFFTLTDPSVSGVQSIEILNGLLILNDNLIDITITDQSTGDFYLPNTQNSAAASGSGALELRGGLLRIEGDDTGMILDGALTLTGGTLDMSDCTGNGNNFIEYSATGEAKIEISNAASTLSVGSQIRRNFFSDTGILDLTITDGSLEIGTCTEGDGRRGMLEVVNEFSNFTHTGGSLTFFNQNGTNASASAASLLLEPATSDLSGSTIVIDLVESNDVNFSINSNIELNDLTIQSSGGNSSSEVVQLKTRPLTIAGDLTINDNVELRSNNLDLTMKGDFTLNDNAFYSPGLNETFFDVANGDATTLGGTNTTAVNFYDFDKKGEGTLNLAKDILVTGAELKIDAGILADNGNIIDFTGQQLTNSGIHSSSVNAVNAGIRFNGTDGQQILTTDSDGIFGNVSIDNADGVSTPDLGQEFRVNNQMTLTTGILDIGPALLIFGPTAELTNGIDAGTDLADFSETNQIQSNSSIIDFGVEKEYLPGTTVPFVFPVGEDNRYTPVKVDFLAAGGSSGTTSGSLRIRPRNAVAPIMLSEDQATQDGVLQYHWLINELGMDGFTANIIANYDDDVIGTDSENTYRGARAIFSDPTLEVENPFPGDGTDEVDDNTNLVTFPISNEDDFSGEYFAGDPNEIPDNFAALVYDNNSGDGLYSNPANYVEDTNGNGIIDVGETNRPTLLEEISGGVVRIADNATMTLDQNGVQFSRLIIPANGTLEIDGTNGHLLGQVSGSGTIRIVTDAPNSDASLPGGDYNTFFSSGSGGALEYTGTGNYDILTGGINQVRSLTLNGSGVKTFVETDITIFEDLNLNEGTVVFPEDQTLTVGGNFNLTGASAEMSINGIIEVVGTMNLTTGSISGGTGAEITLRGDLTRTGATVNMTGANAGKLNLVGSSSQTVTGDFSGANSFANIEVNNTAPGSAIVVSGTLGVDENLILTDGIVATSQTDFRGVGPYDLSNLVSFSSTATFSGGSSASFIDGVVCKEDLDANTTFRFPTGDGSTYAPVIINEDLTGGSTWKARYIAENPQLNLNTVFTNLTSQTEVSDREYWVVQTNDSQTATIGLVYGTQSNVVVPNETTLVSLKDGDADGIDADDQWSDIGRGGLSSGANASGGEITANIASSFSANFYTVAGQTEAALPVELLKFYGEEDNGSVNLIWETVSELDNDFFEVQHSISGKNFVKIGVVDGSGTTSDLMRYSFIHRTPHTGANYYRLKQFDFDGDFEIHRSILVSNDQLIIGLVGFIYPNPASADNIMLRVESGDNQTPLVVEVIGLEGKSYYRGQFAGALYIDQKINIIRPLTPGLYFVNLIQGENIKKVKLLIK